MDSESESGTAAARPGPPSGDSKPVSVPLLGVSLVTPAAPATVGDRDSEPGGKAYGLVVTVAVTGPPGNGTRRAAMRPPGPAPRPTVLTTRQSEAAAARCFRLRPQLPDSDSQSGAGMPQSSSAEAPWHPGPPAAS